MIKQKYQTVEEVELVPNQRAVHVSKEPTDTEHKYTKNNLQAIDTAARLLQSKGGFKLYWYIAKHQDSYNFALSSADFMLWSGLGIKAYNTAFDELLECGYLVKKYSNGNYYIFYDKPQIDIDREDIVHIEINKSV